VQFISLFVARIPDRKSCRFNFKLPSLLSFVRLPSIKFLFGIVLSFITRLTYLPSVVSILWLPELVKCITFLLEDFVFFYLLLIILFASRWLVDIIYDHTPFQTLWVTITHSITATPLVRHEKNVSEKIELWYAGKQMKYSDSWKWTQKRHYDKTQPCGEEYWTKFKYLLEHINLFTEHGLIFGEIRDSDYFHLTLYCMKIYGPQNALHRCMGLGMSMPTPINLYGLCRISNCGRRTNAVHFNCKITIEASVTPLWKEGETRTSTILRFPTYLNFWKM